MSEEYHNAKVKVMNQDKCQDDTEVEGLLLRRRSERLRRRGGGLLLHLGEVFSHILLPNF